MTVLDDATLVAFVDGELDPSAMREVAALIARDPAAEEKVRLLRTSSTLVRTAFSDPRYQMVPPALADRLLRPLPGNPQRRRMLGLAAAACAAGVLGGFGGGLAWHEIAAPAPQPDDGLLADIAEYHVAYAKDGSDFGAVPAAHTGEIEMWLRMLLHRPVRIPALSQFGLQFHAARLLIADDRPTAQLLYIRHGEAAKPLGLCVVAGMPQRPALHTAQRDGVTLAHWGERGFTYVLVGWDSADVLIRLARHLESNPVVL